MTDAALLSKIDRTIAVYERTTGHTATRTRQMLERYGAIDALSRLMVSADLQQGFKALRDSGQLLQTFEALVVEYPEIFPKSAVDAAQWRLDHAHELK